ncbi:MAG: Gfo/Idh/MocA family oxidoreductase [Elusimicrobia bacterium]|nr:Gfo/Idh/MocA family oxidoreductase [Elusimicrobiota bacterium]
MTSTIKLGVVGAGKIGSHHARILSKLPGVQLVGVCDVNLWRAQLVAWRCGSVAYRNHDDLLRQVDAAIIAVPTELHYPVGRAALSAGVHVLIEKPLAGSLEEAKGLLALSEEKKVVLQVGHVERFNPAVLEAIRHIRQPRFITVERLGPYDPRVAQIGVVMDLMIHDLDILLTLVGSEVESLEAIGASLLSKHEDIANVRVRFKTGCIADVTASRVSLTKSRKIRVFQEDSYVSVDYAGGSLKVARKKAPVIKSLADVELTSPKLDKSEPLKNELLHFLDCIRHNRKPWPSGEHGIEALKLALQITEELERYELSDHKQTRPILPSWVNQLARTATNTVLGPDE